MKTTLKTISKPVH